MTGPLRFQEGTQELLQVMAEQYGYDFHHYAPASLQRRIRHHIDNHDFSTVDELKRAIAVDDQAFADLLRSLSVPVTEMFRDPELFLFLRQQVIPWLATFPFIRIWHAGCATGEEAWSMAVLLHEAGLLERSHIYATDFNEEALIVARRGIYSTALLPVWEKNYQERRRAGTGL